MMTKLFKLSVAVTLALVFAGCVSYDRPRHFRTAKCPKHMPGWFQADPHRTPAHAPQGKHHPTPPPPPPPPAARPHR